MKKGHGFVVVYALDSLSSFNNAKKLIPVIQRIKEDWPVIPIVIAANKSDLKSADRQIKKSDGEALADQYDAGFFETSAKTGDNVQELIFDLVRRVKQWRKEHPDLWQPAGGKKKGKCNIV
jgi:GTPase SAR1 family protein